MIIVLKQEAKTEDVTRIEKTIEEKGLQVHVSKGENQTIMGLIGDTTKVDPESIEVDPAVEKVMHVSEPYKLANRAFHPEDSVIDVGGVKIGGGHLAVIAGPCSVESKEQVIEIAKAAKAAGANLLRGGAFKPRTSPYAFQGMGSAGLDILVAAKEATGLPIVSELMDAEYLDEFIEKVDLIQIGARNMQNFDLLKKVGKATKKPILLKRGLSATFQEWIMSAEYIMASGNPNVILCERGVRTFESYTRNTLDLQAVPVIKELTHLPIIIDPSHAGGKWWLVNPMAKAAVAAGCDGLMIEVHNNPEKALCDGPQSLKPAKFEQLMKELKPIADAVGLGLDVNEPTGIMVVDIGADTTEISVISLGGLVLSDLLHFGGNKIDESIITYVKRNYNLVIGQKTAQSMKERLGSGIPGNEDTMIVVGRDVVSGLPIEMEMSGGVVYEAIKDNLESICNSIKMILEKTPPELAKDIIHSGIYITGGSSQIHDLDKLFADITGIDINTCEEPEECVVRGLVKIVSDSKYKHLAFSMKSKILI